MFTICPECQTLFRVRAETLRQAHGRVRCGLCGEQFDALARLSEDPATLLAMLAATAEVDTVAAQAAPEDTEAVSIMDPSAATEAVPEAEPEAELESEPEGGQGDEESIESLTLPEDDETGVEEILLTGMSADSEIDRDAGFAATVDETIAADAAAFGSDDAAMDAEVGTEAEPGPGADAEVTAAPEPESGSDIGADTGSDTGAEPHTLASELAREALLLEEGEPSARNGQVLAGLATLILLVLLAAQWLYMQRVPLYEHAALRPLLQRFCVTLGCELPLPRAPERFEVVNRLVREHPQVPGALLVDLTFVSRAAEVVAYPVLELRLADVSGGRVAGRRFQPTEYLSAGIDPALGVVPNRLTHVNLELMTPAVEMVSFQFEFL